MWQKKLPKCLVVLGGQCTLRGEKAVRNGGSRISKTGRLRWRKNLKERKSEKKFLRFLSTLILHRIWVIGDIAVKSQAYSCMKSISQGIRDTSPVVETSIIRLKTWASFLTLHDSLNTNRCDSESSLHS